LIPAKTDNPNSINNNFQSSLSASTGAVIGNYAVGDAPAHVILVAGNVWVANFGSRNVTRLRASDDAHLGAHSATLQ
jgi:hypothetical protein